MSLKDYLTLSMSGLSLFISFWIFFKNYRNAKMNLGINYDFCIDSNEHRRSGRGGGAGCPSPRR